MNEKKNKALVQLSKLNWSKYSLAKIFGMDRSNLIRIIKRDWEKYPLPSQEEIDSIERDFDIKINGQSSFNK